MDTEAKEKKATFPKQDVEMVLRDELMIAAETEASLHGVTLPISSAVAAVAPIPIDSLVVVELLCAVEPVLGVAIPDATVRPGGYSSVQDALDHLMPRLEQRWRKHKGVLA